MPLYSDNLLINGDFETGDLSGWEVTGTPTIVDGGVGGTKVVKIVANSSISQVWDGDLE